MMLYIDQYLQVLQYLLVLKASLGMPDHNHVNLHYQFITLIDIKLHAQNLIYTSFSFWDLRF